MFHAPARAEDDVFPKTIVQADGTTLHLAKAPSRIVSLTLGTDEILLDVVDPERILALSTFADDPEYSNVIEKAKAVPKRVGANAEQVISLNPDLIFVATYTQPEFLRLIERAKLPVFKFEAFESIEQILENVMSVGEAVGETKKAVALAGGARDRIGKVTKAVEGEERPSVLSFSYGWVAGRGTTPHDIITAAGGRNYAAEKGIKDNREIAMEALLEWTPDYLLVLGRESRPGALRDLPAQFPPLATMKPAREGRILVMGMNHLSPVNHYIADGVEALARLMHPDCFPEEAEEAMDSKAPPCPAAAPDGRP